MLKHYCQNLPNFRRVWLLKILIFEVCQIQSNFEIVSKNQGIVALALLILPVLSEPNKWRVQNSWTGHKSFYYSAGRKSKGKEDEREEFSKSAVNSLVLLSLWLFVGLWGTRRTRSLDDVEEKLKMLGRAGKGNRTRVESSQEGFYGQSIIFSMCNRCGRRTMIPKILGIRKQPPALVSTSFRCGRPILHCNSVFRNNFWIFPPFSYVYICSDRPSYNLTNFVFLFFSDGGKEIIWATCGPNRITRPRIWPLAPWQPRHSHPNVYRNIRWYTTTPTSTFTGLVAPAPTS